MSPTVPINHYFSPGNQRNRTFHANVFKHLPALNTNFFKGNLPNTLPTAIKSRQGLREEERPASIASWRTSQTTPKPNYELDVVAVSQAPSSTPNSPLPVTTMVGQYPTIES